MLRGRVSPVRLGLSQLHRPSAEPPLLRVRCPSEAAQPRQVPGEASRRSPVFSTKFVPPTLHAGGGAVPGAESSAPAGPATLPRTQKRGSRVKGTGREHWNSKEVIGDLARRPIGWIQTDFTEKRGTARQGSMVPGSVAKLHLIFGETPSHAARGLADFSHVWLLWVFSENRGRAPRPTCTPPRLTGCSEAVSSGGAGGGGGQQAREGEGKWGAGRLGVLATRSPNRPNPIGLTLCRLISVEGGTLTLGGVDLLDGTPVLDVKPYVPSYDSIPDGFVRVPDWLRPPPPITVEASLEVRELLHRLLPPAVSSSSSSASSSSSSSSAASLSAAAASTPGPLEQHGAPDPHMRTSLGLVEEVIRADTRSRLALSRTARRPSAHPSHPSSDPSSDASEAGGDDERDLPRPFNFMVRDVRIEYRLDTLPSNQALDTLSSNQAAPAGQALDIRTVATILSAHRCLNATAGSY